MSTVRETIKRELKAHLRSRSPLLWITTPEEKRAERIIMEAAAEAKYEMVTWDCSSGLLSSTGEKLDADTNPSKVLGVIGSDKTRRVYVLRDLHPWLKTPVNVRTLRNLASMLEGVPREESRAVVVLTPVQEIPPEIKDNVVVLNFPLPDREELRDALDMAVRASKIETDESTRDDAVEASIGLTLSRAASCFARSMIQSKSINPALIARDKREVISADGLVSWYDPDPRGMDAVGGLDLLKSWVEIRRSAFSTDARDYGISPPRGMMLVGVPGCGKSLTAKAIATGWECPLLRLDLGALRSKYVGDSESNIRRALQIVEAIGRCIVWVDEIEKSLAGATGPAGDSGVAADALGVLLSWMQERKGAAFVIATANDVSSLPPELLRKGRFDEVFFVDLPNAGERQEILRTAIAQYVPQEHQPKTFWNRKLETMTEGYTGAEIAAMVPDAMFAAYHDRKRAITINDLVVVAGTVAPLSKTADTRIKELRDWAKGRARPASTPTGGLSKRQEVRDLDMED